ncbi:hypothetical protein [Ralstonia sp. UBA689]|uniref:hypothetical protein n=1 Tax=Ralstonia sp. UBA689 TaxID=1947373 RepID=UPI0026006B88|nr:hypothetical protein [Ralstonia sp. UBA689]
MGTKTIWITALNKERDAERVAAVSDRLKRYGLQTHGHFWIDAPERLAWRAAFDALNEVRADLWLVLVNPEDLANPSVRYGLSLLAAALTDVRGAGFPIVLSWAVEPAEPIAPPALFARSSVLDECAPTWPAKIVAKANMVSTASAPDYCFQVIGEERLGQWFSIGPRQDGWQGIVFGVTGDGAQIDFQAVGAAGALPEKTVLEYAQEGLTLQVGERVFRAWAVRNQVDPGQAYYARVKGCPQAVLFMPYSDQAEAEATLLQLV